MKKYPLYLAFLCCTRFAGAWTVHLFHNTPPSLTPSSTYKGIASPFESISRDGKYVLVPAQDGDSREHYLLVGPNLTDPAQDLNVAAGPTPAAYYGAGFSNVNDNGEVVMRPASNPFSYYLYQHWNHTAQILPPAPHGKPAAVSELDDAHHFIGTWYFKDGPLQGKQSIFIAKEPNLITVDDTVSNYANTGTPYILDASADTPVGIETDANYNLHGFTLFMGAYTVLGPPAGYGAALPFSINDTGSIAGWLSDGEAYLQTGAGYKVITPAGFPAYVVNFNYLGYQRLNSVDVDNAGNVFFPTVAANDVFVNKFDYYDATTGVVSDLGAAIAPLLPTNLGYTLTAMDVNGTVYGAYIYKVLPPANPYGSPSNLYHCFTATP